MKVAVGSQNPVKIQAVKDAFTRVYGKCEVKGYDVDSGVSDMPIDMDETLKGAKNRAEIAQKISKADFGVGLEAGFYTTDYGTFLIGIAAVTDKNNRCGFGSGLGVLMPEKVVNKVKHGEELGKVMDKMLGREKLKHREGTIGFLTKNHIKRAETFEHATIFALARFMREEYYL